MLARFIFESIAYCGETGEIGDDGAKSAAINLC